MHFENIALKVPEILLPKKSIDLAKWAVVACDQFTSQPDYWSKVKEYVGGAFSTLNIIFPEVYLEDDDSPERIEHIKDYMLRYLREGVLRNIGPGFVLVDRKTSQTPSRKGLIVALDLEAYDYSVGSQTLIRATEGTIIERLPPRIRIRENSPLESPHIMVLIDDPDKTVIEPLFNAAIEELYHFNLMMDSGHIKGYLVNSPKIITQIAESINALAKPEVFKSKYNISDKGTLLYAMGDGNHSLATAKAIWENLKKNTQDGTSIMNHPARYALVELVNLHDTGLTFEPIHRVLFNISGAELFKAMGEFYKCEGAKFSYSEFSDESKMQEELTIARKRDDIHCFSAFLENRSYIITIEKPKLNLEVGSLQNFCDQYLTTNPKTKIDYIHGEDVVKSLSAKPNNVGFVLPVMSKSELFKTVILDGALPRKTFSMGEADEKRFYLECRKIQDDV